MKKPRVQKTREIFAPRSWEFPSISDYLSGRSFVLPDDKLRRHFEEEAYKRRTEQGDVDALFEYVAARGEDALIEEWVREAIWSWRRILLDPKTIPVGDGDGTMLTARDRERIREWARRSLKRIGNALAFEGGGRKKKRSPKEIIQDNTGKTQERRAQDYLRRALDRLNEEIEKQKPGTRKAFTLLALHVEEECFSRSGTALDIAHERFLDEVKRIKFTFPL